MQKPAITSNRLDQDPCQHWDFACHQLRPQQVSFVQRQLMTTEFECLLTKIQQRDDQTQLLKQEVLPFERTSIRVHRQIAEGNAHIGLSIQMSKLRRSL